MLSAFIGEGLHRQMMQKVGFSDEDVDRIL
jgi:hypothetical protein